MQIIAPIFLGILLIALFVELPTTLVLGLPVLRGKDAEYVRKLLPHAELNDYDKSMLSFYPERGHVSSVGVSLFGTLYFSAGKKTIRIPWWTPLYKEVKAKYAELNAQEKG